MQAKHTAEKEIARLEELAKLQILDSEPENEFDNLVRLAVSIFKTKFASITLVDKDRQWFKAIAGLELKETPREVSFCTYTIQNPSQILLVSDAQKDDRFSKNPFVTGEPFIRFYAGVSLLSSNGAAVGTLCIYDDKVKKFTAEDIETLSRLGQQASNMLYLRLASIQLAETSRKLEQKNEELDRFFQINPDLFCVVDPSGRFLKLSSRWQSIFGFEAEEFLQFTFNDFLHPDDMQAAVQKIQDWNKFDSLRFVNRCRTKDGEYVHLEWHMQMEGELMYASARDISHELTSQQVIAAQKEQFELAISGSNDGIWDWSMLTNDLFLSERWKSMVGYEDHELANNFNTFSQLLHPEDHARVFEFLDQYLAGRIELYEIEFRMLHKDGSTRWVLAKGLALRNSDGKPYRMAGSHTDITERKTAEAELRRTKILLEQAGQLARIGAWEFSLETNSQIWSDVTKEILELPHNFVVDGEAGFNFLKVGDNKDIMIRLGMQAISTGESFDVEQEITTAKGNTRWVRTVGKPEFRDGKCIRLFGTIQDIHQRKIEDLEAGEKVKLQNVIVGSNFGTWQWNIQSGDCIYNERWAEMVGYTLEELKPASVEMFRNLVNQDDNKKSDLLFQLHAEGKSEFYECELRLRHKNGHWIWVFDKGKILSWTPDGKPLMMYGAHQDITERKHAEERLKLLQNLIDNSSDAILVARDDGTLIYLNNVASKRLGIGAHEASQYAVYDFELELNSPEKWEKHVQEMKNQSSQVLFYGKNIHRSLGQVIPVEVLVKHIQFEDQGFIVANSRDISERLANESEMLKIKELLEQTSKMTRTGAYEVDLGKEFILWSDVTREVHEVGEDFLPTVENAINFYKEGKSRQKISELVEKAFATGEGFDTELEIVTGKGNEKWVRALGRTIFFEGKVVKLYGTFQDIDQKKRAELALQESSNRFSAVIESTNDIVFALGNDMNYLSFNQNHFKAMKSIYGLEIEIGKNILDFMPFGNDREIARKDIGRCLGGEQFAIVQVYGDSALFRTYFEANYNPIRNVLGEVEGVAVFVRDITEIKRAEQQLQYELSLQKILIGILSTYINIKLPDVEQVINHSLQELGEFVEADRSYIFDYDFKKQTSSNLYEWCADGIEPEIENLQNLPLEIFPQWVEKHRLGELFYVPDVEALDDEAEGGLKNILAPQGIKSLIAFPMIDQDELIGYVGFDSVKKRQEYTDREQKLLFVFSQMLINIKNRQKREQQLVLQEEKYRNIITNVNLGLIEVDTFDNIVFANQSFSHMSGYSISELIGKSAKSLFLSEKSEETFAGIQQKRVQGVSDNYQLKVVNKVGETRWWFISGAPNYNDSGQLIGSIGIHLDVTDQKRLQDEQQLLLTLTQNQNDRLKNFAHIVSHNLRSHTINIKSLNELMMVEKPELKELELSKFMTKATNNLLETIEHLSEVAILNTNEQKQLEKIDLADTVIKAIHNVKALAIISKVKIINELEGNEIVLGIPAYIESVVLNILTNAIKYRSPNRKGFVKLSCGLERNYLTLRIEDNGLGIDLEMHGQKLFGMYKTFHKHPDSRGIGLFITKNQVEAMGGRVEVESQVDKGTIFKIFFQHAKS